MVMVMQDLMDSRITQASAYFNDTELLPFGISHADQPLHLGQCEVLLCHGIAGNARAISTFIHVSDLLCFCPILLRGITPCRFVLKPAFAKKQSHNEA